MSLYPFYQQPLFYYPNEVPNPILLLESLSSAHQMGADHTFIMKHLKQCMNACREYIQQHSVSICRYLKTNLEANIRIIETIECLPLIHDYMSPLAKRQITAHLCQQYPSNVCFHEQIITLAGINLNLVEVFVRLMRSLTKWFRKEVEERNYSNIEVYELQHSINVLYAEERYKFDNNLQIDNQEAFDSILYLYRFVINSPTKLNEVLWKRLMDGLFYFLCNKSILLNEASRYVYYSIRQMMAMRGNLINVQRQMVWLIMPKIRKAGQAGTQEDIEGVLGVFRDGIVNLLASAWTVELECFWLWSFKLACDLLQVQDKMQLELIKEIRIIYREIVKYLSS